MAEHGHTELRRLFDVVIEAPPAQRSAILDRECRGDAVLRQRIEAMIAAAEDQRFLSQPTADVLPSASEVTIQQPPSAAAKSIESPGTRIGPYKLLQQIGEGGFGSVFMAEQEKPVARKVALKIIKLGMDTRAVIARFEAERQALAMMDHPNIARVLDAGATETGRPYFVMDLVKGDPIAEYCDKNNLSIEARLDLFAQVCLAVQHAHTKGIIHRDIKPSNVLVSTQDGKPAAKVIDFGIAKATASKLTEKTLFTEHKQLIGTPEYMSPEQAEGSLDIDTRTDVYSLGVMLYELLTGSTPFSSGELRSAAYGEIQRIIREVDPPKPSTRLSQSADTIAGVAARRQTEPRKLGMIVRGELDWIVMKALEKDRTRRYETANGLAMDIRRYLSGEAIVAAPPSSAYKFSKFIRRNKGAVTAGAAIAAALVIGVVAFAWQAKVAKGQRDRAVAAETESNRRAGELKQVSEFQAKMLNQIDATEAGTKLMSEIRAKFAAALSKAEVPESERSARAAAFARDLSLVNSTDIASEMIDRTILKPAIQAVDTQFKDQPVVDASLRDTLAELYRNLGLLDTAISLDRQALATRERILGQTHRDTLKSTNDMGVLLENLGKMEEAEPYYKKAYEERRRTLGEDDPDTLTSMSNLGNYYRAAGKFAEAEPLLKQVVEKYRRVMGDSKRDTLIALNQLGFLYIGKGKAADAEPLWREAYEKGRRALGEDDRDVLVWTNNLAGLLQMQNKFSEAEPLMKDCLERHRRTLGEDHPGTLRAISVLGGHYSKRAMFDQAEPLYREVLDKSLKSLGPEHPDTLTSFYDTGTFLMRRGKLAEAEPFLKQALEGRRKVFGPQNPDTLVAVSQMAKLLNTQNKYAESEALYRETLAACRKGLGNEHPDTLILILNLGNVLLNQDKLDEAETLIREALEGRKRISGDDHPETLIAGTNMAKLLEKRGNTEDSLRAYRELLERFRRVLGNDHPNTLSAITNVAGALRGKPGDAEPLWREAATGFERKLGKDHVLTAGARMGLGKSMTELSRFSEAEPELLEASRAFSAAQGVSADRRKQCAEALAALYEAWDKAEPGKGHDLKAAEWKTKRTSLDTK